METVMTVERLSCFAHSLQLTVRDGLKHSKSKLMQMFLANVLKFSDGVLETSLGSRDTFFKVSISSLNVVKPYGLKI